MLRLFWIFPRILSSAICCASVIFLGCVAIPSVLEGTEHSSNELKKNQREKTTWTDVMEEPKRKKKRSGHSRCCRGSFRLLWLLSRHFVCENKWFECSDPAYKRLRDWLKGCAAYDRLQQQMIRRYFRFGRHKSVRWHCSHSFRMYFRKQQQKYVLMMSTWLSMSKPNNNAEQPLTIHTQKDARVYVRLKMSNGGEGKMVRPASCETCEGEGEKTKTLWCGYELNKLCTTQNKRSDRGNVLGYILRRLWCAVAAPHHLTPPHMRSLNGPANTTRTTYKCNFFFFYSPLSAFFGCCSSIRIHPIKWRMDIGHNPIFSLHIHSAFFLPSLINMYSWGIFLFLSFSAVHIRSFLDNAMRSGCGEKGCCHYQGNMSNM